MVQLKQLGRYEILEPLGRGAMGVVYKARDPLIDRTVALKTISYAGLSPAEVTDFELRFFQEAKSAGRLNHPNIVTIYDVGHSDGLAYFAMEYLTGESLRDVLDSGVVLPPKRIARIAYSVAKGMIFAHQHGVIHRDIKPANIMELESGLVKITDFGIALLPSGSLTLSGTAVGSPKYISPEQILGKKADQRSDIFSLGVVLYEMLTGVPPFVGEDLNATLYQVLNVVPPLPSSRNAELPLGFDRIVARALAKDPNKRYQTAAEMAADIRNYKRLPGLSGNIKTVAEETTASLTAETVVEKNKTVAAKTRATRVSSARASRWASAFPLDRRLLLTALAISIALAAYFFYFKSSSSNGANSLDKLSKPAATLGTANAGSASTPVATKEPSAAHKTMGSHATKSVRAEPSSPHLKRPVNSKQTVTQAEPDRSSGSADSTPVIRESKASVGGAWLVLMKKDLMVCEQQSFFSRVVCREKVAWKYCPGHWGKVKECPQAQ